MINSDQTAYVRGRYIGTSIRNLLDIFEYCENSNTPGALLCIDFKKAFDTIEHDFMYAILKKFNFGKNFIRWIKIMYTNPMFKVKNNGWISSNYSMTRGIRQGCPVSALIFILVAEVLAASIRQSNNIQGIQMNGNAHKIVQFADDATICVENLESIEHAIQTIKEFSTYAGPVLNMAKTKGIWLGCLKDLGLRKFANITWTGNPVKMLGIYAGHSKEKCNKLNWDNKLENIDSVLQKWNRRNLTLFGRVKVIKTYALPKIILQATVLTVPESIKPRLKNMIFNFLWGKKDKIKRSVVTNKIDRGGLNMIDIDKFLLSLQAGWVKKITTHQGKWCDLFHMQLGQIGLDSNYIFKTTFRKI